MNIIIIVICVSNCCQKLKRLHVSLHVLYSQINQTVLLSFRRFTLLNILVHNVSP